MSTERLLQLIAEQELIDSRTLAKLESKVAQSPNVSPKKIVKLLLDRNEIDAQQASQLLADATRPPAKPPEESESSLGLRLIDDDPVDDVPEPPVSSTPPLLELADDSDALPLLPELPFLADDIEANSMQPDDDPGLIPMDSGDLLPREGMDLVGELPPDTTEPTAENVVGGRAGSIDDSPLFDSGDLSSDGLDPAESRDFVESSRPETGQQRPLRGRIASWMKPAKRANRWDSPLLLIGGGGLLLLSFAGVLLWFILTRGSGDEFFAFAEDDYQAQSYTQAIDKYEQFIKKFPSHDKVSKAQCRIRLARMRRDVEAEEWDRALQTAQRELVSISQEKAFEEVMPELQGVLPDIYGGIVQSAADTEELDAKQDRLAHAQAALELINNPEFLPTSQRQPIQGRIVKIQQQVAMIERDVDRDIQRRRTLKKIAQAVEAGETSLAYKAQEDLLRRYPGLSIDPALVQAVQSVTAAEAQRVEVVEHARAATKDDDPAKPVRSVVLADVRSYEPIDLDGAVVPIMTRGSLYAVNADTGAPIWRRWLGFGSDAPVLTDSSGPLSGLIAYDQPRQEIVRLATESGDVQWRLALNESALAPVKAGLELLVATESGKIITVNAQTGNSSRFVQLPQRLAGPPAADLINGVIFQAGMHSSLYALNAKSLQCLVAYYLGHESGSVTLPPIVVDGIVMVIENVAEFSRLHILKYSDGAITPAVDQPIRLDGPVTHPMIVDKNRVFIVTELGAIYVYSVDPSRISQPARQIVEGIANSRTPLPHYALVDRSHVFVAADSLVQYEVQASKGELVSKWVERGEATFVGPFQQVGDVLIQQCQRPGSTATTLKATQLAKTSTDAPKLLWETDLSAQPAGPAFASGNEVVVLSTTGAAWTVGASDIEAGIETKAGHPKTSSLQPPLLQQGTNVQAMALVSATSGQPEVQVFESDRRRSFRKVALQTQPHERLATPPIAVSDGYVACTSDGPLYRLDAEGKNVMMPFQPDLFPDKQYRWLAPVVMGQSIIVAEREGWMYRLQPDADPQPRLVAANSVQLPGKLKSPLVGLTDMVAVVLADPTGDSVNLLSTSDLKIQHQVPLAGQVIAGIHPIGHGQAAAAGLDGNRLQLVMTDGNGWVADLPATLVGAPVVVGESLLCATISGKIVRLSVANGDVQNWPEGKEFDVGQPLGTGPRLAGRLMLLVGCDCTLHMAKLPDAWFRRGSRAASP